MEWWEIRNRIRFRYTREQRKAMKGKIPMTSELYWGCMDVCYARLDQKTLRWLLDTWPEYMRQYSEDYDRRLREDAAFREQQEREWQELRAKLVAAEGEEWVKEHCRD